MVFKSTSGFSTYTNTPYLVGSCAIYTHRVSIIRSIIVHSDTRVEFSFFVIASGRSRSGFHSFQAKEEERKQLYVRSASSGLRFFYLSGRERKPNLILDRKIEAFVVSDAIAFLPKRSSWKFIGQTIDIYRLCHCTNRHSSHKFLKIARKSHRRSLRSLIFIFSKPTVGFLLSSFSLSRSPKHTNRVKSLRLNLNSCT